MAQILVRNLDEATKAQLQREAKRNGRSMETEAREILRTTLHERQRRHAKSEFGLGTEISELFRGIGLKEGEEIQEMRGFGAQIPNFNE
jgi:plasmid stability protein